MRKYLICYAGKSKEAEDLAQLLSKKLISTAVCDLTYSRPDLESCEAVIVGSQVRRGKMHKAVRRFLSAQQKTLSERKLGIFACGCNQQQAVEAIAGGVPELLRKTADCAVLLPPPRASSDFYRKRRRRAAKEELYESREFTAFSDRMLRILWN